MRAIVLRICCLYLRPPINICSILVGIGAALLWSPGRKHSTTTIEHPDGTKVTTVTQHGAVPAAAPSDALDARHKSGRKSAVFPQRSPGPHAE